MLELELGPDDLTEALERIEAEAAAHALSDARRYRIRLLAEEILSNVLRHANFSGNPPRVTVTLAIDERGDATLRFRDCAAMFNPLKHPDPDLDRPLYSRKPGGLGIYLLKQLAREVHYRYENGYNILELTV
jgi:anti-sigma regulatory factor (Ser/Thr protein kinase)